MRQIFTVAVLFFLLFPNGNAQLIDMAPRGSFKAEIGLPNNISNYAFRDLLQGLVVVSPSYQYTFENSFSLGAGFRYGLFNVNQFKNNLKMTGSIHTIGVYGKIGQEKYYGNFGVDYGVRVGYSVNLFDTNKNRETLGHPYSNDGGFIEPMAGFYLKANDYNAYSLSLGYAFHSFKFQPHQMGVEYFSGINPSKLNKISSYFTIGFGYSFFFHKKQQ